MIKTQIPQNEKLVKLIKNIVEGQYYKCFYIQL